MVEELFSYVSKVISVCFLMDDYFEILFEILVGFIWEVGQYMCLGLFIKEVID